MKRSGKEIMLRVVILMIGLAIAHLGVTLFFTVEHIWSFALLGTVLCMVCGGPIIDVECCRLCHLSLR